MKKFAKIFTMIAICFVCAFGFVACGKNPIVSGVVKNGTLITTVVKGEQVDTSKVEVVLTYQDKTTKEVSASDLEFSTVDTQTTGTKKLTITYSKEKYSFDVEIKVVATEMDVNSILSLSSGLLTDFNANKNEQGEYVSFKDKGGMILAGSQNAFHFRISASGLDAQGRRVENLEKFRTVVTLERWVNSAYVPVGEDAVEDWVSINPIGAIFNFKQNAVGEQFRITVKAANPDESAEENQVGFKAEVKVVDAFNVYSAKELCVYDNARENGENDSYDWSAIKAELGLTGVTVKGIVLQNRIVITKDDVPAEVFWTKNSENFSTAAGLVGEKNLIGTPIDRSGRGLFTRKIANGEEFNFYGNYFTVDLKEFPKMVVDRDRGYVSVVTNEKGEVVEDGDNKSTMMTAHLCVFFNSKAVDSFTSETSINWSNIGFYGNGGLSKNKAEVYTNSGGVLLMKSDFVNFNAKNTVMNNFYIGYFFQRGDADNQYDGHYVVEDCRGFNSYQCLFYLWGAEDVTILKSEFKHAGGPAIIADHVDHETDGSGGYPTKIDIVESEIESKITGKEPWFATYRASSIVQQLATVNDGAYVLEKQTLNKDMKVGTVDGTTQMNLVLIFKSASAESVTASRINGKATVYKTVEEYEAHKNGTAGNTVYSLDLTANNRSHETGANLIDVAMTYNNVYFQDTLTGKYVDGATAQAVGSSNNPYSKGTDTTVADAGTRLSADSEYVNVYLYLGMAGIFGLTPKTV